MESEIAIESVEKSEKRRREILERLENVFRTRESNNIEELRWWIGKIKQALGTSEASILPELGEVLSQPYSDAVGSRAIEILNPIIDFYIQHPDQVEYLRREQLIDRKGYFRLSKLLYYEIDREAGMAILHVGPGETLKNEEVLNDFSEGMKKLAEEVSRDESIKTVLASSWIVAERPGAMQYAGFTLGGAITDEERSAHFADEERPVAKATMSRETLLKKYGRSAP